MKRIKSSIAMRVFLLFWSAIWTAGVPLILGYLWHRGRKDPLYFRHLAERFGFYSPSKGPHIWVHAVSLGEFRSAMPLISTFLESGEHVVVTLFTPAGRREAVERLAPYIKTQQASVVWVPLEIGWAFKRFFGRFQPRFGLVMEIEIWPRMVFAAKASGIPLFMCNAQYPTKAIKRDSSGLRLRQEVIRNFAGAFVKSSLQKARFSEVGLKNIHVTGELRFEQSVPAPQVAAGQRVKSEIVASPVIAFVSTVEDEEAVFIPAMKALSPALAIYVPRRPERFEEVAAALRAAGLRVLRRSEVFPPDISQAQFTASLALADVLLGDSMGEMYFYLALADRVVVGGGFHPKGAHNIIEPLALGKPVVTGPYTWTIEYPFSEAATAGVAQSVPDAAVLVAALQGSTPDPAQIARFFDEHSGGKDRFFAALPTAIANCG